jgi:hypothetical protein
VLILVPLFVHKDFSGVWVPAPSPTLVGFTARLLFGVASDNHPMARSSSGAMISSVPQFLPTV